MNKENIFTVSEVTKHIKNVIESNIPTLFVEGEIANFTRHISGHIYFSLKDTKSSLRSVFFRSYNSLLNFKPKEGDNVICSGKITVYEKSGNYQLNVTRMFLSGVGELQLRFEELKRKLFEEGLFDETYKKPIPQFPERIGVITSATGAAFQDIRNVISRRYPCEILLYPATVQGDKAAKEIVSGIKYFNITNDIDLLIIGRGGGSQEDLFCLNDENLARAIFASNIPIISGIGHEIDFTIADFVADLRAPTPSVAAELAVPDKIDLLQNLQSISNNLKLLSSQYLYSQKINLQKLQERLNKYHPQILLQIYEQRLDEASLKLGHNLDNYLNQCKNKLFILDEKLKGLSPYEALKRGYSILRQNKKIINSIQNINKKNTVEIILTDGNCICKVEELTPNSDKPKKI